MHAGKNVTSAATADKRNDLVTYFTYRAADLVVKFKAFDNTRCQGIYNQNLFEFAWNLQLHAEINLLLRASAITFLPFLRFFFFSERFNSF